MAVGLSTVNLANAILNTFRSGGGSITAKVTYLQLHTIAGDPGASGTANVSALTTRNAITWATASGGSMSLSSIGSYTMTATETIRYVSIWDAATSGNFLQSLQLTSDVPVINGSTFTVTSLVLNYTPVAA